MLVRAGDLGDLIETARALNRDRLEELESLVSEARRTSWAFLNEPRPPVLLTLWRGHSRHS